MCRTEARRELEMGTARSLDRWGGGGGGSSVLCSQSASLHNWLDSKIIQIIVHRLSNWEMLYANDLMFIV